MRRAEGGAKIVEVFRVKNHDFTPKNLIFSMDPPLFFVYSHVSLVTMRTAFVPEVTSRVVAWSKVKYGGAAGVL